MFNMSDKKIIFYANMIKYNSVIFFIKISGRSSLSLRTKRGNLTYKPTIDCSVSRE